MASAKRNRVRVLVAGLVLLVVLSGGYLGIGVVLFDEMTRVQASCGVVGPNPRFADVTPATLRYTERDFGATDTFAPLILSTDLSAYRMPDFQDVSFPSRARAGIVTADIHAWWVPASSAAAPAVILVHGRGSCRRDWNVEIPAGMLHRAGFAVLMLDLRNQGDSAITDGRYFGGVVEKLDVLGAWDWLATDRGLPAERIGLFGASLGASAVMLAAGFDHRVSAVWEDSGYADTQRRVEEELGDRAIFLPGLIAPAGGVAGALVSGVDIYGTSPLSAVRSLARQHLFIVHGLADQVTQVHHAQDLYDAARASSVDVQLWIVPFAGHTWAVVSARAEYERRLVQFFQAKLGAA